MLSPLSLFTAQIVAVISVLLLATGYLKADMKSLSSRVFAVLSIFVVFYILSGMTASHIDPNFQIDLSNWQLVVDIGVSAISGLFMIYCFLIFQEGESFPRTLGVALLREYEGAPTHISSSFRCNSGSCLTVIYTLSLNS